MSCIWITGLPGAGKSTLAKAIAEKVRSNGVNPIVLDGDDLRGALLHFQLGYEKEDRKRLAFFYAKLCKMLSDQGHFVICATVSMFDMVRDWNRENIQDYYEVFLDVPLEILKIRNQKGLYSLSGKFSGGRVPGMEGEIEFPKSSDFVVAGENQPDIFSLAEDIIGYMRGGNEN
ncbi:adenylyl-sulfate kinase [Balneatrix alpica]|uniref:Adenylyl-sulfate kinase n=1 Tax=Balneatrix alpica TaxID=75684 RepID=A0ABV5ZHN1_9GAMM|nr:adenylyl-sulfate kinase [Balneatrix alpica]